MARKGGYLASIAVCFLPLNTHLLRF